MVGSVSDFLRRYRLRRAPVLRYRQSPREDMATQGRIQIDWLDASSRFVKTDIRIFDCSPCSVEHAMEVICTQKAAYAVVYCSGHASLPLIFERNSFRQ